MREVGTKREKPVGWKDHVSFLVDNDLADFETGSKVTGNKFCFLKRDVALLELALQQWAISKVLAYRPEFGETFIPISPPDLAHPQFITACGFIVR